MAQIYWVEGFAPARIAVAARPRGGDWLHDDMAAMRAAGLDILISALPPEEARQVWLHDEGEAARAAGLEFVHFPVPNLLTPVLGEAAPLLAALAARVKSGASLAAHCYAGQGRSPMLVASILALLGHEPDEIWPRIRLARGIPVPDTDIQRRWVRELALYFADGKRNSGSD